MNLSGNISSMSESEFWSLAGIDSLLRASAFRELSRAAKTAGARRHAIRTAREVTAHARNYFSYAKEVQS